MRKNDQSENWKTEDLRAERKERLDKLKGKDGTKKKIRKKFPWVIVLILIVAAAIAVPMFYVNQVNNGLYERTETAALLNGEKITALEANFFLGNKFRTAMNTAAFTADGQRVLTMVMPGADGKMTTLRDSLLETFPQDMENMTYAVKQAKELGLNLNADQKKALDDFFGRLQYSAAQQQLTVRDLLASFYGRGATEQSIRPYFEDTFLALNFQQHKMDEFQITDDEYEKYYAEHKDDLDTVDFHAYTFNLASFKEEEKSPLKGEKAEEEKEKEKTENKDKGGEDKAQADAKKPIDMEDQVRKLKLLTERANEFLDKCTDEASFKKELLNYVTDEEKPIYEQGDASLIKGAAKNRLQADMAKWLFNPERKAGDKTVIESPAGITALYFVDRKRPDGHFYSSRHILIKVLDNQEGEDKDQKQLAKERADEILQKFEQTDKSEDAFAKLAEEYSEDPGSKNNGGLYENVAPGSFVSEYEKWCLDKSRKPGDVGIVYVENPNYKGYHIIYFKGLGDVVWKAQAGAALKNEKFNQFMEDAIKNDTFEFVEKGMQYVLPYDHAAMEEARENADLQNAAKDKAEEGKKDAESKSEDKDNAETTVSETKGSEAEPTAAEESKAAEAEASQTEESQTDKP